MSDTEKIINALKDEYSYWQNTAYKAQKEGNEERTIWYYGKATGIKKSIETIEKMKDYGIIL
nr:MAG TPA: hypothetical protein [Bacteriophage sp.]